MSDIKIFTDSTSDLTPDIIKKYDISVIPLYVNFKDESFLDGVNITAEELYAKVEQYGQLPKTAACSPSDYYNAFRPYIDGGKQILYIGLSSGCSSSLQNAVIASKEFSENTIEIVDSLNLSTGIGLLVLKAVDCVNEGLDLKTVAEKVQENVPKVRTEFVIDTLDYLYKGGRCTALQSFVGAMLKIRPIVKVVNGRMILGQKIRGKREKALEAMLNNVLSNKDNISLDRIMITYSEGCNDVEYLNEALRKEINAKEIITTKAGSVISSHCGPNTVGILYIEK